MEQVGFWVSEQTKATNVVLSCFDVTASSIVDEGIRTVLFFYQDILYKNKTPKYLNTPKTHNKAHSLGKKYPDKIVFYVLKN